MGKVIMMLGCFWSFSCFSTPYIFVSHSMPDKALQSYFQEAQMLGGQLIMRGLLNDSFMETKAKAAGLKISYDIHPELFETYGIKVVPAIVQETEDTASKVSGHIPLETALNLFGEPT